MLAEEMREFLRGLTDAERDELRRELRFFGKPDKYRRAIEHLEKMEPIRFKLTRQTDKQKIAALTRECKELERKVKEIFDVRRVSAATASRRV